MNKYDMLFVRACKSRSPLTRVRSVYHRFYTRTAGKHENFNIARILASICDKYNPMSTGDLISALNPDNNWRYGILDEDSHWTAALKIMISHLRLSEVSKFDG